MYISQLEWGELPADFGKIQEKTKERLKEEYKSKVIIYNFKPKKRKDKRHEV